MPAARIDAANMRVLIARSLGGGATGEALASALRSELAGVEITFIDEDDRNSEGDVLLAPARSGVLRAKGPAVPWVHIWGTGVDALPRDVYQGRIVTCSRGVAATAISEFVFAAILAFEKRVPEVWVKEPPARWSGMALGRLAGKRLAVLGLGSIGSRVAVLGNAFGMEVRGLGRTPSESVHSGVALATSPVDLVTGADHVVITAPLTRLTMGLVNEELLSAMPRGVHVINVARGDIVDHDALRAALDDGHVARATLDTVVPEPLPRGHWLYHHPSVRVSPHVSFSIPDASDRLVEHFVRNVVHRYAGRTLEGIVDPAEGY
jgi:phosphoglycerate dehydrogenase-like enzyme